MIVVTGANGFIGSVMVTEINSKFPLEKILAVDTILLEERNLLKNKNNIIFISSKELLENLHLHTKQITLVIHLGACSSTTEKNWEYLLENNFEYTKKIFNWCTQNSVTLIYASSAATYGDGSLGFSESVNPNNLQPLNLYGESKIMFDRWALEQKSTPPHWYGLRFFNVYGPNENFKESMASVVRKAFYQIKKEGKVSLFKSHNKNYEDGKQLRDFIYVKDVTRWILEISKKLPENGIYNMGYGKASSWLDLTDAIFETLNIEKNIEWIDMPDSIKEHYQYFTEAEMSKWNSHGLSKPEWPLKKAIKDYVSEYLNKNDAIY